MGAFSLEDFVTTSPTNANSTKAAAVVSDADSDTLTTLIIRKRGQLRGKGADRKRYGDDLVCVQLLTGFDYHKTVRDSLSALSDIEPDDLVVEAANKGLTGKDGKPISSNDIRTARRELAASMEATLAGQNSASTDGVFDPLTVDGQSVRGARVYSGPKQGQKTSSGAAVGTIYLQGLKRAERILEGAANGPLPPSNSSGKVVAKNLLRQHLDVGNYVSYRLEPSQPFILRMGGTVAVSSSPGQGMRLKDATVQEVFGV
jgi:hypothetical protein